MENASKDNEEKLGKELDEKSIEKINLLEEEQKSTELAEQK